MLPLLTIDYDLGVDLHGSVPARGQHTFEFSVRTPHGAAPARAAGATAYVSYDDGASWTQAKVSRHKDAYRVKTDHRGRTGHVSLKVTAWDRSGGTVEQTIKRAFALR
ncbi:hypothetical protein E1286_06210 [Nonomuraea terrae]|uniref:Uncharacterized protein n=1 Tax=Nonomuraea terrae TaxID=2530383 RepID=A0A4R4Z9X8_9ACTN|nr:hypothetical protein [Nonomuraea terrae]TDD54094.1 hypothetical protein E1286_06210 [Nonomuraea terrae]